MKTVKLTDNEKKVLVTLQDELEPWIGQEGLGLIFTELAEVTNIAYSSLKGIVGSLVKKEILDVYEQECDGVMHVSFKYQWELTMEEITEIINNG